ncbi:MAG TPA: LysE family transporter [Candidatus Limnocylindrales bacterium]|jgi:threonine/homoserine/homoserine lactone efflux protein|nr:LysE family transporter [Candidatus Limnocylindrales bacterium]
MDFPLLARAIGLGFTIAAAIGPISLLTIRRTLAHGQLYGLVSGLGVALADGTYAAIAAFGLTAVTSVLVGRRVVLGIVGGLVLVWLGFRTLVARPSAAASDADRPGLPAAFASIYALTMTNPMTILSFAALFAALGLSDGSVLEAATLTLGVLVGSALWWVVLTTVVGRLRSRVTLPALTWVNRLSGALILAFGVAAIVAAVRG